MVRFRSLLVWGVAAVCLLVLTVPVTKAEAALGLTDFAIDGNTAGPNDWDSLPPTILENATTPDACGVAVLDPDQLDGKLADLDLDAPNPTPGNVVGKGDLCRVWRATEAVADGAGGYQLILYGAWRRFASNGEVTLYWPLIGPQPGKGDDVLVAFDASSSGSGTVGVLVWNGTDWVPGPPLPAGSFEAAVDEPGSALFGEFALNLTAANLWPADSCTPYASEFVLTRTGNAASAELQDYVGLAPTEVTRCADLVIEKQTTPAVPDPPEEFGYQVTRDGGGDVLPGEPSVTGTLTVPGDVSTTLTDVTAAEDYQLTEPNRPAGWTLESIECEVLDPSTGRRVTIDVSGGDTFPVAPGHTTHCTIRNVGPASLTIVKTTVPAGADQSFDFTGTRQAEPVEPFALTDGDSHPVSVSPGDTVTVAETVPPAWSLAVLQCTGDQEATTDISGAAVTVSVDAGEQIVCTFVNKRVDQIDATLIVAKSAPGSGTGFDFTVTGRSPSPDAFTLTPPDRPDQIVTVSPAAGGSTYTVTEQVPDGWQLTGAGCADQQGRAGSLQRAGVSVSIAPGQVVFCRFVDQPIPPPARLTIVKTTDPAGGTGFDFDTRGLTPTKFTLDDTQSRVFNDLSAGEYQVSERVPDGWVASGGCDNDTPVEGGRVDITLGAGDDVVCTFHNQRRVSLTVTKQADPEAEQDFTYSVARNRVAPGTFILDDDGDPTDDLDAGRLPSSITGDSLLPGLYTITESSTPGWQLVELQCTGGETVDLSEPEGRAIIRLGPGQSATCRYDNRRTVISSPTPTPTTSPSASPTPSTSHAPPSTTSEPAPPPANPTGDAADSTLAATGAGGLLTLAAIAGEVLVLAGAALLWYRHHIRT